MKGAPAQRRVVFSQLALPGAGVALLVVYLLTLAPGVTFWDAGEFIAAVETFGIPHPPGTPLYVLVARAWRLLWAPLPAAFAVNLLSAVATAVACTLGGDLLRRAGAPPLAAAAAALASGLLATVWSNATEAEVYSLSLLLSATMLWLGGRAGESGGDRWRIALAYAVALAAPLHASALVAAPAAVALAARGGNWRVTTALGLGTAVTALVATGRWTMAIGAAAVLLLFVGWSRTRATRAMLLVTLLGLTPLVVMLLRARHDPWLNQGNPDDWRTLLDVVARRQYAVAPMWPRQAPVWLQLANFAEYADWQVALSAAPEPQPHPVRTAATLLYAVLGVVGYRALGRDAPALRTALGLLLASSSLGVVAYLNLKAGPSIGWGLLPDDAPHEARERDYFFALFFWSWGLLAGYGVVRWVLDWRAGRPTRCLAACALLALPLLLNWQAVDRTREPEATAPARLAASLLESAPRDAVLFVWGDNDTYPLWHAQSALGTRRDVLVVTIPLVSAQWYRDELRRRAGVAADSWRGELQGVVAIAAEARRLGREPVFAATVPADTRNAVPGRWRRCGPVWTSTSASCEADGADTISRWLARNPASRFTDPTTRSMLRTLECAARVSAGTGSAASDSLDSTCNAR